MNRIHKLIINYQQSLLLLPHTASSRNQYHEGVGACEAGRSNSSLINFEEINSKSFLSLLFYKLLE